MRRALVLSLILMLPAAAATAGEIAYLGGDGSSVERAILIQGAAGESDGIAAEYDWLRRNRPGSQPLLQSLLNVGDRAYDRLEIRLPDGRQQAIYFDITGYFGRY